MKNKCDRESIRSVVVDTICDPRFLRGTFGGPTRGKTPAPWLRVIVRPVSVRGQRLLQFSYFDRFKDTSKNYSVEECPARIAELLDYSFSGIHLTNPDEEIDIRLSKKGQSTVSRKRRPSPGAAGDDRSELGEHNRIKDLPLPEGRADHLLQAMGILNSSGSVRPTMRPKFTQINEFLKQLLNVLEPSGLRSLARPIEILDCGCGSSYLTLAVHHYLNNILELPATITGVDVNDEVIRKSNQRAHNLSASGLNFTCGRINQLQMRPDIVLALHACDTATDDAIAHAIINKSSMLLAVPCCHRHLNKLVTAEDDAKVLRPVMRHGILHQRLADLLTDSFRALILRIVGYQTDVIEFVSTEHTARNVMIRATRSAKVGEAAIVAEYHALRRFLNVTPYLETLLGDELQQYLA